MNKSMNIGIIGTGVGLRLHYQRFNDVHGAKIIAISGSNEQRTIEFAKQFKIPKACTDYKELCEMPELDLIVVASPNLYHYNHVLYAQKCNKHILAEKPLAMNLTEIKTLARNAENSSKICIINHQLRFNPYIKKVKELILDNAIGDPYFIRIHQQSTSFSNRNTPWSWKFDEIQGGGVRLAMASHLLDTLQYWLNKKCYYVRGAINPVIKTRFDNNRKKRNITASSFFSANLSLEQNIDVQLSATAASCGISRFDFSIYGTTGELHFDIDNKLTGAFLKKRGIISNIKVDGIFDNKWNTNASFFSESFRYFAPLIYNSITLNNKSLIKNATSFKNAIPTQIILDAIRESAISGNIVKLTEGYH